MGGDVNREPLLSDPKRLLPDMAWEQSLADLLRLVVDRVGDPRRVALVRTWQARPTTDRVGGPGVDACRDRPRCLHLAAGGGRSRAHRSSGLASTGPPGGSRPG